MSATSSLDLGRVVRADLGAETVLERRDDAAAVGVVLGVGRRDEQQVERQPQRVAADLDVALLEHVEERDLDALGEVGQLVEAEDAAVGARDEAVVHRLGVAERAALRHLDRVDVADEVADARVGRRELLGVALARGAASATGRSSPSSAASRRQRTHDGCVRVVADLAALDDRAPLVEQARERAHEAGLALAALAEQDEVVSGEQRRLELGQHGLLEADHARGRRPRRPAAGPARFSRISLLTLRWTWPEARSSPRVVAPVSGWVIASRYVRLPTLSKGAYAVRCPGSRSRPCSEAPTPTSPAGWGWVLSWTRTLSDGSVSWPRSCRPGSRAPPMTR